MKTSRTIRAGECREMPWKNGGGSTTEIAVEPPGAGLDRFDWRISSAEVRGPGPFSPFPGCDRVIVQLDGPPISLAHGAAPAVELEPLVPYAFAGDDETECAVAGVAHDFNLIVRRDVATATLLVRALSDGEAVEPARGATSVVYVLEGALDLPDGDRLGPGDARVDAGGTVQLRTAGGAVVLVARLTPR